MFSPTFSYPKSLTAILCWMSFFPPGLMFIKQTCLKRWAKQLVKKKKKTHTDISRWQFPQLGIAQFSDNRFTIDLLFHGHRSGISQPHLISTSNYREPKWDRERLPFTQWHEFRKLLSLSSSAFPSAFFRPDPPPVLCISLKLTHKWIHQVLHSLHINEEMLLCYIVNLIT